MGELGVWQGAGRARLVRLCAVLSGDREVAEDLAQETLLEAWRHRHKLSDPHGANRWLTAIARNVCLRWGRSEQAARCSAWREPSPAASPPARWG